MRAAADLEAGLLAVGDRDRDRAVGALLADQRLVRADAEDQDPGAHGVVAAIAADGARRAVLLALAAAHDAQRAQQLVVDGRRDRREPSATSATAPRTTVTSRRTPT